MDSVVAGMGGGLREEQIAKELRALGLKWGQMTAGQVGWGWEHLTAGQVGVGIWGS